MLKEFTMLYVINILYYLIADLDLLLVISCYSKLCYGVKIVLSQDEYLLPTTSKPLIYLCFLRSYNYTRTTEKACNRNGYRLSSYLFSMGFPFSFPFTASEKRIYACSDGKVSAKKMSGEGHSPDTFSINFSILAALFCFIWSVTCP